MSHIWTPTVSVNSKLAQQLIEQQFHFCVTHIELLGQGFDNTAYLVNNSIVFRFARRQMAVDCLSNEIQLLPYIQRHVSFALSVPTYVGHPTALYPFIFAGYHIINGMCLSQKPVCLVDDVLFTQTLAKWLKELHHIPVVTEHKTHIQGDQNWRYNASERLRTASERIEQYAHYFKAAGFSTIYLQHIIQLLSCLSYQSLSHTSYIHGDLYSRHILVDESYTLTGIIDWGDIHIGNRSVDLAFIYSMFTHNAQQLFFQHYGTITTAERNFALLDEYCHSIALIAYCYENNQEDLKQWTLLAFKYIITTIESN